MAKAPLKATDRRRAGAGDNVKFTVASDDGAGKPLANLLNTNQWPNGKGKRAV